MNISEDLGYINTNITRALSDTADGYQQFLTTMGQNVDSFVTDAGNNWACAQAQEFFKGTFAPCIQELYSTVKQGVDALQKSVVEAQGGWAKTLKGSDSVSEVTTATSKDVDVGAIKDEIDGFKGMKVGFNVTYETLSNFGETAETCMKAIENATKNCGFKGAGQEEALLAYYKKLTDAIKTITNNMIKKFQDYLNSTAEAYGGYAQSVADGFSQSTFSIGE